MEEDAAVVSQQEDLAGSIPIQAVIKMDQLVHRALVEMVDLARMVVAAAAAQDIMAAVAAVRIMKEAVAAAQVTLAVLIVDPPLQVQEKAKEKLR